MSAPAPPPDTAIWQRLRRERAPDPAAFQIDARRLDDLLRWASGFAGLLTYFPENGPEIAPQEGGGPWKAFLNTDVLFLLAEICARDAAAEYRRNAGKPSLLTQFTAEDVKAIVDWRLRADRLAELAPSDSVEQALAGVLRSAAQNELFNVLPANLKPQIPLSDESAIAQIFASAAKPDPVSDYSLVNRVVGQIAARARDLLDRALKEKFDHAPHVGLLLAFFKMFEQTQARINDISERHLDFYYDKVLRLRPRAAAPDRVDLALLLDPKSTGARLEKGAGFVAGSPSAATPAIFRADDALDAAPIVIRSLRALVVSRRPQLGGGGGVAGVWAYPQVDSADGFGAPLAKDGPGWAAFGPPRPSDRAAATLGFAVSSSALTLPGGLRRITLTLHVASARVARFADAVAVYRREIGRGEPISQDYFLGALAGALAVSLSSVSGFFAAPDVAAEIGSNQLVLFVTLPPEAPGVAPFPAHPVESRAPLLQVALAASSDAYALSLFAGLDIGGIDIAVAVEGLLAFTASAATGPVSPEKPFQPFGPLARSGNALFLDSPALRQPGLSRIRVDMEWQGLPKPPETFADHYQGYGVDLTGRTYLAELALNRGDHWLAVAPAPGAPADQPLFAFDDAPEERIQSRSALVGQVAPSPAPGGVPALRLTLAAPDAGFGQTVYPAAVTRYALAQAAKPTGLRALFAKPAPPPPNPPLAPEIRKLSIAYEAAVATDFSDPAAPLRFFSLTPLGEMAEARGGPALDDLFHFDATLLIGFDGVAAPRIVSFLFDVEESTAALWSAGDGFAEPRLTWRYFDGRVWRALPDASLPSDGTKDLTRSGVMRIALPPDLAPGDRYPGGWNWLAVEAQGDVRRYGAVRAILPNGVAATRDGAADVAAPRLVPGEIARLATSVSDVKGVTQPRPSRGGRAVESQAEFRLRVSERLSHRGRAVLAEDYGRLALDAFPDLSQASVAVEADGRLALIVVPQRLAGLKSPPLAPLWLCEQIGRWFRRRTGIAAADLYVRNAEFETVRISARIKLGRDAAPGLLGRVGDAIDLAIAPWLADPDAPLPVGTDELDVSSLPSALRAVPGVAEVAGVSAVQIYRNAAGGFGVTDSARGGADAANRRVLKSAGAAAVLFPAARHDLQFLPAWNGIGNLEIGRNFYVPTAKQAPDYQRGARTVPSRPKPFGLGAMTIGRDFVVAAPNAAVAPVRQLYANSASEQAYAPPFSEGASS